MMIDTGGDALRQYAIEPEKIDDIRDTVNELIAYANDVIRDIHSRYTCVLPALFEKI
jgi:hypothetical protein